MLVGRFFLKIQDRAEPIHGKSNRSYSNSGHYYGRKRSNVDGKTRVNSYSIMPGPEAICNRSDVAGNLGREALEQDHTPQTLHSKLLQGLTRVLWFKIIATCSTQPQQTKALHEAAGSERHLAHRRLTSLALNRAVVFLGGSDCMILHRLHSYTIVYSNTTNGCGL